MGRAIGKSYWLALAFLMYNGLPCSGFECLSPSGTPVDWFIMYKLPVVPKNPNPLIEDGIGFYYMDVNKPTWVLSNVGINQTGHALYNTLNQVYKNTTADYTYALYNDQPPDHATSLNHGHTKGGFAFDNKTGFWLIMSIPDFPSVREKGYIYPESGKVYGQSILCVSLNYTALDVVAKIMTFTYPRFYDKYFPSSFETDNPIMKSVLAYRQSHVTDEPYKRETTMYTKAGKILHNFAKSAQFQADLYDNFLAPSAQEAFYTETWQNGPKENRLPSNCSIKYKVYNVQDVKFPELLFKETKDHSKWAVSKTGTWICIGDINRQTTQFHRGGSTMCFIDSNVWREYSSIVRDYETCGPFG